MPFRTKPAPVTGLDNPASVFCERNGGKFNLRTAPDGSVQGFCVFPDQSECDEWTYFRLECKPANPDSQNKVLLLETHLPLPISTEFHSGQADGQSVY